MKRFYGIVGYTALLCCGTALSGAASAQGTDDQAQPAAAPATTDMIGDIVVTARRREESLQSVPLAITAFSDDKLKQQAIFSSNDLDKAVPGLTVASSSGSPGLPTFAIRGRGTNYGAAAGAVETYFADVPLSAPFQAPTLYPQFFDLQSFQVLKGPQGTLFGRSTTGGAVVIVPRAPDDTFGGYVRLQGGTYGDFQAEGAINIPLAGDKAALRIAGFVWQRDGYSHSFAGTRETLTGQTLPAQDFNNRDQQMIRATLLLKPSDTFTNSTVLTYQRVADQASAGAGRLLAPTATGFGTVPDTGFGTQYSVSDVRFNNQPRTAFAAINTSTLTLSDALTIKNIAGYITAKGSPSQGTNADGNGSATISLPSLPYVGTNHQFTDELQLQGSLFDSRLNFIVGGLADITREPRGTGSIPIASGTIQTPVCTTPTTCTVAVSSRFAGTDIDSFGLFASGTFEVTPKLSVTAAFRHSWDHVSSLSGSASQTIAQAPGAQVPSVPQTLTLNETDFQGNTYNFGIDYHVNSDTLVYGGYRRGYKRGGFNDSAVAPLPKSFGPEGVDDFFGGLKTTFNIGGARTRFNVEGYYDKYQGQQVSFLGLALVSGVPNLVTVTTNVDKTTYAGFEFDLQSDVTKWLTLEGNYAYTDANNDKWTDTSVPGLTQSLADNPVPYVSKNKFSLTARLHGELPDGKGELVFAPTVTYQDSFNTYVSSVTLPYATQATLGLLFTGGAVPLLNINGLAAGANLVPSRTLVDLRVEWNHVLGSRFDIAANATNLTNKTYYTGTSATVIFGVESYAYGPPRMFTFDIKTKF
ncbi:TonB-dependent receptor [Sphingomonas immobilis]|uniref:TonB-dependent receptor n=1 Tax=Sphingomonas immobilis TaxID=3063997 RepID=A0ABT8ZXE3_9SPHN|nr:TonB-dependent receptor [Sphingomonas sp. CA1-15]MDO7842231.1 TonB-dependent receptor [Sphingomonas sp. CA1-15]